MSIGSFSQHVNKLIVISRFLKGCTSIHELDNLPARYIQAIYNQYSIFAKSQEAQQAAASEDIVEELEDGGMGYGGSVAPAKESKEVNQNNLASVREQQLKKIRENIAAAQSSDPDIIYLNNIKNKSTNNNSS